jgi:hypothetical protein
MIVGKTHLSEGLFQLQVRELMKTKTKLSELIANWVEQKPSRNIRMLARLSGISYSSVWRAANNEGEISQSIALAIASVVLSKDELHTYIESQYPHLIKAVVNVKRDGDTEKFHEFIQSPEHFKILVLASAKNGTSSEEVTRMYGEKYQAYFDDLIDSGELISADNRWYFTKDIAHISLSLARQMLSGVAKDCNPKNDTSPYASYAYLGWESLNEKAAKNVYKSIERFNQEIYDIVSDQQNKGDVLVVYGLLQNVIKGQEKLI